MDEQTKKLKNMWQKQKSNPLNSQELTKRLNQMERKEKFRRIGLLIVLIPLIIASIILVSDILANIYFIIAYILLFSAIIIKLVLLYRSKYSIITDELDFNNYNFIEKLNKKLAFSSSHILIYMSLAILAINCVLLGTYEVNGTLFEIKITAQNRIPFHLSTIVLFVIGYLRHKKCIAHTKKEASNLLSDLGNDHKYKTNA
jgi:hypothetical protein